MTRTYKPRPKTQRPCQVCGRPAVGRKDVRTCSPACRTKAWRQRK